MYVLTYGLFYREEKLEAMYKLVSTDSVKQTITLKGWGEAPIRFKVV